jgi:hydrogenase-4 component B
MLWPFLAALGIHLATGVAALVAGRSNRFALAVGTAGSVVASTIGVAAAAHLLLRGGGAETRAFWHVPALGGELRLGVDALSAFFLLSIYLVSGLAAVYGSGTLRTHAHERRLAPAVFFFALLTASMAGVALARDGILFLIAWEMMSLSGFFLVTFEDGREEARRAGMVYLIASHLGVVCLFVLFALFLQHGGDFHFASIARAGAPGTGLANACFLLALAGFGTKAGFWFLHTWLPEAHPAAPSHVSATMSGVMIKMGIYGLLRVLTLLGPPPPWWGIALIAIGAVSGVLGILHALGQHDLKRLLAYSSVENVGVVVIGIGLGLLGQSAANPAMALLGYGGALLHTLNHGLFKGLLFHGAGSVLYATGTKEMDALGGLFRKMPVTALTFLVASIAISGLPPLNGFVSEWLIYVAAFRGGAALGGPAAVATIAVIPTLALIGGLAAACFVRAFGIPFLGAGRTAATEAAHDPPLTMRVAMILGAAFCIAIGLWPTAAFQLVERPAQLLVGTAPIADPMLGLLVPITRIAFLLLGISGLLTLARWALLRRRQVAIGSTWGCGYEAPTSRMQYTASSFAEPVIEPFAATLHRKVQEEAPTGYFPQKARHEVRLGDLAGERLIVPATRQVLAALGKLRVIQQGRVHLYLVYILVTVVVLLVWQLSWGGP